MVDERTTSMGQETYSGLEGNEPPQTKALVPVRVLPAPFNQSRPRYGLPLLFLFLGVATLGMLAWLYLLLPLTIDIVPKEKQIDRVLSLALSEKAEQPGILPVRRVVSKYLQSRASLHATQELQEPARSAHGIVHFYNRGAQVEHVGKGLILTAKNGVQVMIMQTIEIPAVIGLTMGSQTVEAEAVLPGSPGNLVAGSIDELCLECGSNDLIVRNDAFVGGKDATKTRRVAPQDVAQTQERIRHEVQEQARQDILSQLPQEERLIKASLVCKIETPSVQTEAENVEVVAQGDCAGESYFFEHAKNAIRLLIETGQMKHYEPDGRISVQEVAGQEPPSVLHIRVRGLWRYALSAEEQQKIVQTLARKNPEEARAFLLTVPGVNQVTMSSGIIPWIPQQITVHVPTLYAQWQEEI